MVHDLEERVEKLEERMDKGAANYLGEKPDWNIEQQLGDIIERMRVLETQEKWRQFNEANDEQ